MIARRTIATAVVVVVLGLSLLAALDRRRTANDAPAAPAGQDIVAAAPATAVSPPIPAAEAVAPLPPPGKPFDTVMQDLVARADSGDAPAACRLSLELLRCRQVLRMGGALSAMQREKAVQAETVGMSRIAEHLLVDSDRIASVEASCRAVPPELLDRAPHWLRQAALAGDREALLQYVDGRNLFTPMDYSYLRSPHFDRWRREAPALLLRMLAAGEPQAALWMAEGRGGGEGAIQGLLADDPERAQAWIAVVESLFRRQRVAWVPVAPPAEGRQVAVQERAARWRARWYGDATFDAADLPVLDLLSTANPNAVHVGGGCGRAMVMPADGEGVR